MMRVGYFSNLLFFAGIGQYPVLDSVRAFGTLSLAFSSEKPDPVTERNLGAETLTYMTKSVPRAALSDGFNAYVGMLGALYASDYKAILIDEPEAFLHPALARTLGKQIAQQARDKQVFIATHSADFLMGAIEAGENVRIVRLQYQAGVGRACLLDKDELRVFMNDPLLRSANVMSGLFSKAVVVGESDTDRAFYQEINTRLLAKKDPRGIEGCVFLNAQNKQTVPRIVRLLRRMGVPAAGIVDLDVLAEGGGVWASQLEALATPEAQKAALEAARLSTFSALKAVSTDVAKKNYKTEGGLKLLDEGTREAAANLLDTLDAYGLFVVPGGEVEQWLSGLGVSHAKPSWLRTIFEAMGANSTDVGYVQPAVGDVWDFIGQANAWFANPQRKGMTAIGCP
ncbi:ATP-dependent nuclease [Pseudorhodobacter ferrugineus]|nr:AAA family ATPase [Pseudorhodobacter ferrugineus]